MGRSPQKKKARKRSAAEENDGTTNGDDDQESPAATTRRSPRKRARQPPPQPPPVTSSPSPKKARRVVSSPKKEASRATATEPEEQQPRTNREVFVVPTTFGIKVDKSDKSLDFVHLRHPKTGSKAVYLIAKDNSDVCEVLCHEDPPSSWFVGNNVQESGKIFVCTAIDPLFLVVPYLQKTSKYMLLDQLLMDDEFPSCVRLASCLKVCDNIHKITDSKKCGNELAYRFNDEKAYEWLQSKVKRLVVTLEKKQVHVGDGARAATYVPSNKEKIADKKSYTIYAVGVISEYLSEEFTAKFLKHLGFEPEVLGAPKPSLQSKKNCASSACVEPTENYSTTDTATKKAAKPAKLTPTQRALNKVDKTGMKSISSFFAKK